MAVPPKRLVDVEKFKSELRHFWRSVTRELSCSGFEVKRDRAARTIPINQQAYIEAMVNKFRLTNAKPVSTPMEMGAQYTKEARAIDTTQERHMRGSDVEAIGCVLWRCQWPLLFGITAAHFHRC